MDFEEVADELYAVLPAEFIAARTDAVAQAKTTDKGLARRIGELGKPTLAAWTVNLLVRGAGDQVQELVELGDLLRRAQDDLDPEQLRALDKQRRQVVRAVAREAAKLARRAGNPVSEQVVVQVEETLKAAVADPSAAELVLAGRLTGALTYNGLGTPSGSPQPARPTGRPPRRASAPAEPPPPPVDLDAARAAKAERAARRETEEQLRAARAELRSARAAVDDAAGEAEQAGTAAKEAAQAAGAARRAREDADGRVQELETALAQARERAAQAADEAATADREAEQAEADRTAADEDLQRAEADRDAAQRRVDDLS